MSPDSALAASFFALPVWCGLLGMAVGSFLNVVCWRLPKMMERQWRDECCDLLGTNTSAENQPTFNLAFPPSHCPHCGHAIKAWENIPVVSFLLLRGKCAGCSKAISVRYPLVEVITGVLSAIVAMRFGFTYACLAGLGITWALLALAIIDADTGLLPDTITLPLLWAGLLAATQGLFCTLEAAVLGAVGGYLSLWLAFHAFKLLTGKEGMGFGDFKLFAALGAWLGWQQLPLILLLSSAVGATVGLCLIAFRHHDKQVPIPFGPYLAAAGWISLLWGSDLVNHYIALL